MKRYFFAQNTTMVTKHEILMASRYIVGGGRWVKGSISLCALTHTLNKYPHSETE